MNPAAARKSGRSWLVPTIVIAAGGVLAVYAAGMVAPLLLIAALWQRLGSCGRQLLCGRSFKVGKLQLHTTSVLTGLLLIAVGVLFWTTNGLVSAPSLLPTDMQADAASWKM